MLAACMYDVYYIHTYKIEIISTLELTILWKIQDIWIRNLLVQSSETSSGVR